MIRFIYACTKATRQKTYRSAYCFRTLNVVPDAVYFPFLHLGRRLPYRVYLGLHAPARTIALIHHRSQRLRMSHRTYLRHPTSSPISPHRTTSHATPSSPLRTVLRKTSPAQSVYSPQLAWAACSAAYNGAEQADASTWACCCPPHASRVTHFIVVAVAGGLAS